MITSHYKINKQAGFTLVEMLVAVAIFVIVAMVVTSVFITLANANRKAQSIRLVMDNLNFAIDSVALKMREATNYSCEIEGDFCNNVSFTTADDEAITYYLGEQEIESGKTIGRIFTCPGLNCTDGTPITAEQVNITGFLVSIERPIIPGVGVGRARAALLIKGTAGNGRTATAFNIQTTVAERNYSGSGPN